MYALLPSEEVVIKSLPLSAGWLAGLTEQMVGLAAVKPVRDPEQHPRSSMQMKSPHSVHSSIFSIFRSYNVDSTTCQTDQTEM